MSYVRPKSARSFFQVCYVLWSNMLYILDFGVSTDILSMLNKKLSFSMILTIFSENVNL